MEYEKLINYAEFLLFFIIVFMIIFIITAKISETKTDKGRKLKEIRLNEGYYNPSDELTKDFVKNEEDWFLQKDYGSFKDFLSKKIYPIIIDKLDTYEIPFK